MDYEKKYNEALERAKQEHGKFSEFVTKTIEEIFPELRESEDEIVRKGIIDGMKCIQERGRILFYGMPIKDVIVWLEKQKEQKPAEQDSEEVFDKIDKSFRKGREVGFREGVESVKPAAWSEEDRRRYLSCLQRLGTGDPMQPETINSKWFKEHVSFRPSWKPSEEQMEAFRSVLEHEAERVGSSKHLEKANSLYEQLKKL